MAKQRKPARSGEYRTGRVTRYNKSGDVIPNTRKGGPPKNVRVSNRVFTAIVTGIRERGPGRRAPGKGPSRAGNVKPMGFIGVMMTDPAKKPRKTRVPKLGVAPVSGEFGRYAGGNFDINLDAGELIVAIAKLSSNVPVILAEEIMERAVDKAVEAGQKAVQGGTGRAAMSIIGDVESGMGDIYSTMPDWVISSIDEGVKPGARIRHAPHPMLAGLIAWKDAVGYTGWAIQLAERIQKTGTKPKRFIAAIGRTLQKELDTSPAIFDGAIETWWYGAPLKGAGKSTLSDADYRAALRVIKGD